MNTRTRARLRFIIPLLFLAAVATWLVFAAVTPAPAAILSATQDSCAGPAPASPCLSAANAGSVVASQQLALWGVFLIGITAGLILSFVLTAPAAYNLGRREGYNDGITMRRNIQHASRR